MELSNISRIWDAARKQKKWNSHKADCSGNFHRWLFWKFSSSAFLWRALTRARKYFVLRTEFSEGKYIKILRQRENSKRYLRIAQWHMQRNERRQKNRSRRRYWQFLLYDVYSVSPILYLFTSSWARAAWYWDSWTLYFFFFFFVPLLFRFPVWCKQY